ncbi:uncharacterized protein LY89DRAFT_767939 [Mollisia scopiformis]|uniref:Uncharacterized protein n=1 Tax=Mollisia scopiformis TaxID=149040 RepID=A0A194XPV0_MOLSC|nr:uncharacterized protein LY89DRAFT_767939 [Mollisia scopiformis]KUJ21772.1 hypothetical protein LY89DRAFT_767939 [Mollisia scopiformis]
MKEIEESAGICEIVATVVVVVVLKLGVVAFPSFVESCAREKKRGERSQHDLDLSEREIEEVERKKESYSQQLGRWCRKLEKEGYGLWVTVRGRQAEISSSTNFANLGCSRVGCKPSQRLRAGSHSSALPLSSRFEPIFLLRACVAPAMLCTAMNEGYILTSSIQQRYYYISFINPSQSSSRNGPSDLSVDLEASFLVACCISVTPSWRRQAIDPFGTSGRASAVKQEGNWPRAAAKENGRIWPACWVRRPIFGVPCEWMVVERSSVFSGGEGGTLEAARGDGLLQRSAPAVGDEAVLSTGVNNGFDRPLPYLGPYGTGGW